jgi:hypothetical protein
MSQFLKSFIPKRRWILPEYNDLVNYLDWYTIRHGISQTSLFAVFLVWSPDCEVDYAEKARFRSLLLCCELWSLHDHPAHRQRRLNVLRVWGRRESRRQIEISNYCICDCDLPCSRTIYYDRPIPRHPRLSLYQRHWKLLQISSSKQQLEPAVLDELRFLKGTEDASVPSKTTNCLPTAVPLRA